MSKKVAVKNLNTVSANLVSFSTEKKLSSKLWRKILALISNYKFTQAELLKALISTYDQKVTLADVSSEIKLRLASKELFIDDSDILVPASLTEFELENWHRIGREMSQKWLAIQTQTTDFFSRSQIVFNKTFKMEVFNEVYEPLSSNMEIEFGGKKFVLFTSNDYLGLSKHPDVISRCIEVTQSHGHGSGGSRVLSGTTRLHRALEDKIASFKSTESAIVLSSGYMTNLALFSILRKDCVVFFDAFDHMSILEGLKHSGATGVRFKHNDVSDLREKLAEHQSAQFKLVIVEGVYSMEGDIGDIKSISQVCKEHRAYLAVDEAHSCGTIGATGRGVTEYFNLAQSDIDFRIGTLGKAFGAEGGYIAAKSYIIELLKHSANPFIFSTSLPASVMAGATKAFELVEKNSERVTRLQNISNRFRTQLKELGFNVGFSNSQIVPIIVEDEQKLIAAHHQLKDRGFLVNIVTFPAVPLGQSRLRFSLSSAHTDEQLESIVVALKEIGIRYGII